MYLPHSDNYPSSPREEGLSVARIVLTAAHRRSIPLGTDPLFEMVGSGTPKGFPLIQCHFYQESTITPADRGPYFALMENGELSWVRSFAFATIEDGGWSATALTDEIGSVTTVGRTFEEAQAKLRSKLIHLRFAATTPRLPVSTLAAFRSEPVRTFAAADADAP